MVDRTGNLKKKFGIPPFSVLDTKQKYWQDRKRKWRSVGIKSEVGREELGSTACSNGEYNRGKSEGGSIFDEALTETMYKWFCPEKKSVILDPFAGGSVRGVIAAGLGYKYRGIELRQEQVEANREQWENIKKSRLPHYFEENGGDDVLQPEWIQGDAEVQLKYLDDRHADFLFSCPPYYDLEVYSNEKGELSNLGTYDDFVEKYARIIDVGLRKLKRNRFAAFVVANIRDKEGYYRNLVGDTVEAFEDAGAGFYNDIILVNAIGSLPIRVNTCFPNYRKVGKMHQNVLVFFKGDPDNIPDYFDERTERQKGKPTTLSQFSKNGEDEEKEEETDKVTEEKTEKGDEGGDDTEDTEPPDVDERNRDDLSKYL